MSTSNTDIFSYINKYLTKEKQQEQQRVRLIFFPSQKRRKPKSEVIIIIIITIIIRTRIFSLPPSLHLSCCFSSYFESVSFLPSPFLISLPFFFSLVFKDACKRILLAREGKMKDDLELYVKGLLACLQ